MPIADQTAAEIALYAMARHRARLELRSAAWCRRAAATHRKGGRMRAAELHEARNRIREAREARVEAELRAARP